jgi:phosphatidate phosphatase APP1
MPVFNYISNLLDDPDPVIIIPYGGYANEKTVHALARVLEDEGIKHTEEDSVVRNIWNSFKRFESDEKPGAEVQVITGGKKYALITDHEGYVSLSGPHQQDFEPNQTTWFPISYNLFQNGNPIYHVSTSILKPSCDSTFAVISDLDDTVIHTGVTSLLKWRLLVNSFMKHSHTRLPLEGVQKFYNLLHKGAPGDSANPFFYLSNSPWNLYDYLVSFLDKFSFPKGVILLRDLSFGLPSKKSLIEGNKYRKMVHLMKTFPTLPFILIGDAAEVDADIYLQIARKFPNRVLTIYIRSVNRSGKLIRIKRLIEANTDIEMVLIHEGAKAIDHARARGYIG